MKIGIIGMTTTGLAAGAALANAGFETLLYCPDDEEAAEFLDGNLPVYEQGLQAMTASAARSGNMRFVQRMEPALDTELVLFAQRLLPEKETEAALRFILRDIETAAREIGRDTNAAVLTCLPPGSYRILSGRAEETSVGADDQNNTEEAVENKPARLGLSLMPCAAAPGQTAAWFRAPSPALIGTENPDTAGIMREVLRRLGASRKKIRTASPEQVEEAVWLKRGLDLTLSLFAGEAKTKGISPLFSGICENLRLPEAGLLHERENLEVFADLLEQPMLDSALEQARFQNESYIDGIVEAVERAAEKAEIKLSDETAAVTGLAQYPGSGEMRGAAQVQLLESLVHSGLKLRIFVSEGTADLKWRLRAVSDRITFCQSLPEACDDAKFLILAGKTKAGLNLSRLSGKMQKVPILIDPFDTACGRKGADLFIRS